MQTNHETLLGWLATLYYVLDHKHRYPWNSTLLVPP